MINKEQEDRRNIQTKILFIILKNIQIFLLTNVMISGRKMETVKHLQSGEKWDREHRVTAHHQRFKHFLTDIEKEKRVEAAKIHLGKHFHWFFFLHYLFNKITRNCQLLQTKNGNTCFASLFWRNDCDFF
jgi:hypothetical protein